MNTKITKNQIKVVDKDGKVWGRGDTEDQARRAARTRLGVEGVKNPKEAVKKLRVEFS
jgi:hypothetical protein